MEKKRSDRRKGAATFVKPPYWSSEPPPKPRAVKLDEKLSPTRYGDWEKNGIAIDF